MAGIKAAARTHSWWMGTLVVFYTLMMGLILGCLLFLPHLDYQCKKVFDIANLPLLLGGMGLMLALMCAYLWLTGSGRVLRLRAYRLAAQHKNCLYLLCLLLLLLTQVYIARNVLFRAGWDPGAVLQFAHGRAQSIPPSGWESAYFSRCPNNLLLTWFYSFALRVNQAVGVWNGSESSSYLMSLVFINCLISCAASALVFGSVKRLTGSGRCARLAWAVYCALIGLSPWFLVAYSDAVGLLFPILICYLLIRPFRSRLVKGLLIGFAGCVGYLIKPQAVIVLIAVMIVKGLSLLRLNCRKAVGLCVRTAVPMVAAALITFGLYQRVVTPAMGLRLDPEASFTIPHFLMIGLNEETTGGYSEEDVRFSASFKTNEERGRANLQRAMERLKTFGPAGYAEFLVKKTLFNYNDGTFGWGGEGDFSNWVCQDVNTKASPLLKSIYYHQGTNHHYLATFFQGVWLLILAGCLLAGCALRRQPREAAEKMAVVLLSLVGLTLFELLFEARARYLYTFAPVYLLAAVLGWRQMLCVVRHLLSGKETAGANQQKVAKKSP